MHRIRNSWREPLVCLVLAAATLAVFWPLSHHDFIVFDDGDYVSRNAVVQRGLTVQGLGWAFTTAHASNWHPLTWISHMLDCQLCGLNPSGHHVTNLVFHTANAMLLFLALRRMTGSTWRSAFVAALFALHPLHVESVAWVSERKDVLSTFFFMLTLAAYAKYVEKAAAPAKGTEENDVRESNVQRNPKSQNRSSRPATGFYLLAIGLFALGLMSKPMVVTLPFVLFLLDYWPLNRFGLSEPNSKWKNLFPLLLEKLPFLALAAASSAVTLLAQKRGGAVESLEQLSLGGRLSNAAMAYACYLEKAIWPVNLGVPYLRPEQWPIWNVVLALLILAGISTLVLWRARSQPYLEAGWLWYVGMLVPVIGLVQVGSQFMADRYTYLPMIGIFIILAWGTADIARKYAINRKLVFAGGLLVLLLTGVATQRQVGFWKDSETLFEHSLAVTRENYFAHNMLGVVLGPEGRFEEAKAQFLAALRIYPNYADALHNLGILLTEHGDFDEATSYLRQAVRLKPQLAATFGQLGLVLDSQGRTSQAIIYYRECVRLMPDQAEASNNLAWILATNPEERLRNGDEAVRLAEHACVLTGFQQPTLLGTLAAAYAEAGRFSEAASTAEKAISLATAAGQNDLADRNRRLMEVYRQAKAYHESRGR